MHGGAVGSPRRARISRIVGPSEMGGFAQNRSTAAGGTATDDDQAARVRARRSQTGHQLTLLFADWASGSDGSQPLPAVDRTGAIDAKQTYDFVSGFSARAGSYRNVRSVSSVRARLFLRSAVTEARILAGT